ncbi:MAG: hypothetical protein ACYDCO_14205 [Armatimonadota bacterium]
MNRKLKRRLRIGLILLLALVAWHLILNIPPRKYPIFPTPAASYAMDDFLKAGDMMQHTETIDRMKTRWWKREVTISKASGEQALATLGTVLQENEKAIDCIRQGLDDGYLQPLDPREIEQRYGEKQYAFRRYLIGDLLYNRAFYLSVQNDHVAAANALIDYWQYLFLVDSVETISIQSTLRIESECRWLTADEQKPVVSRLEKALAKRISCAESIRRERPSILYSISDWSALEEYKGYRWYTPRWVMAAPIVTPSPLEERNPVVNHLLAWMTPNFALPGVADRYLTAAIHTADQPISSHPSYPGPPLDNYLYSWFGWIDRKEEHSRYQFSVFQQDGCLLSLALQGYRKAHGRYPARLEELVAEKWLTRLPVDPYTLKGTYRYQIQGAKFTLYSTGPDGKDDVGKPINRPEPPGSAKNQIFISLESLGDVVYYGIDEFEDR